MQFRLLCTAVAVAAVTVHLPATAADEASKPGDVEAAVTGSPPAEHPFAKVQPGMKFDEAVQILGKPTSERAFCTGKHYIPFYYGRDRAYTEYYYQGQGVVVFYTEISTWGIGRYAHCSPKTPFELAEVHYNPKETGVAPGDGEERKKDAAASVGQQPAAKGAL